MTDEENQRQRHLAEMMIAQCDGKIVQDFGRNADPVGRWLDIETPIAGHYYQHAKLRIKPEPREWWICVYCMAVSVTGMAHKYTCPKPADAKDIHVREVLEP